MSINYPDATGARRGPQVLARLKEYPPNLWYRGEQVADVGNRGEMTRDPEAVDQGRGDGRAEEGECSVGEDDPAAGGTGPAGGPTRSCQGGSTNRS